MSEVVLMSIEPRWVREIFAGRKRYEYRKSAPSKSPPFRVVVYSTSPQKKIVGEFEAVSTTQDSIESLINRTISDTPHEKDDIQQYFGDRETGYALEIGTITEYDQSILLSEMRDDFNLNPPQNFSYISEKEYSSLRS